MESYDKYITMSECIVHILYLYNYIHISIATALVISIYTNK